MVQNAHFGLKYELKHFTTPYMQLPPPAVFHDKAKRTQQGNLLGAEWEGGSGTRRQRSEEFSRCELEEERGGSSKWREEIFYSVLGEVLQVFQDPQSLLQCLRCHCWPENSEHFSSHN